MGPFPRLSYSLLNPFRHTDHIFFVSQDLIIPHTRYLFLRIYHLRLEMGSYQDDIVLLVNDMPILFRLNLRFALFQEHCKTPYLPRKSKFKGKEKGK